MWKNAAPGRPGLSLLVGVLLVALIRFAGGAEGVVTITWSILPRQTLSEFPGNTSERAVSHPFELPRPLEAFAIHEGRVVLSVRSNIPWVVTARLDCVEDQPIPEGLYLIFQRESVALECGLVPLATGELGEHLLVLEFTVLVPQEGIARGSVLERTLVFEIFPLVSGD